MPTCDHCGSKIQVSVVNGVEQRVAVAPRERRHARPNDKRAARGALCKQVMQELKLPSIMAASQYIKEHNLYSGIKAFETPLN
jgi:hypothetical protein